MNIQPTVVPGPTSIPNAQVGIDPRASRSVWLNIRSRLFSGLFFVLPIVFTLWVIWWLYKGLEKNVIDPIALLLLWKLQWIRTEELPFWFENYAAPVIAIILVLVLLYCLGFFVNTRLRTQFDWMLMRIPLVSVIYDGFRGVFKAFDKPRDQQRDRPMVLVSFPHPGIKVPAFVTATCKDIDTQKTLVCVYVPTTPVPTSGYFLMVPEEDVMELNWSTEQTLQAIMSGGLTAPQEVRFFKAKPVTSQTPIVDRPLTSP
jgi:uncharacterized membrane protein